MPRTKSAEKALRQNKRRRERNIKAGKALKDAVKNYRKLVSGKNKEEAQKQLSAVYKKLDKAAKANLIKKGKADRLKSRLSRLIKTAS